MSRKLSILTWNVWFDQLHRSKRYKEILDVCLILKPDVICFQEVTPVFKDSLELHSLSGYYELSRTCWGTSSFPYGVMSLCKKELQPRFEFEAFPTEMNRNLLKTCIDTPHGEVCIGNVHLESLENPELRALQLGVCKAALAGTALSVLCGDFNICSYRNYHDNGKPLEQLTIDKTLSNFRDAWVDVHQQAGATEENSGYTFDTVRNGMLTDRFERWRYDRIMYSARAAAWQPISVDIIGDRPVGENVAAASGEAVPAAALPAAPTNAYSTPPKKEMVLFPSDHFGLYSVFGQLEV